MKIEIKRGAIRHNNIINYIILILIGILISSTVFALLIKPFAETGIWLGLLANAIIIFCGFYYTEKGNKIRPIIWSMLTMIILLIIIFVSGISIVSSALEGF